MLPQQTDAATLSAWHAALEPAEQARAARFVSDLDRHAYIAAHALARRMLAEAGGLAPDTWRFVEGPAGKPEVAPKHGMPWLRFNISHTRNLVACAVARDDDVGLDVEDLTRREAGEGIAERFFAPSEAAMIAALPRAERHEAFLRIWTLKEAFVKATGEGIAMGLENFGFTLGEPPALAFAPASTGPVPAWRFLQFKPTATNILAVALRRRQPG
ncbi:4'-phosphopantetheinyl transferase family protein [Falsiroseomonas ponticola]|uniref:4'-phosphopantetheinyl transferase family protein n=1 Tax=Falsiroseomonas ponticola TaxID=2786951 RepID=UPI001931A225|nr:4'-phosphopantetheinyl transferase superfamily protein [Roseomonas ponticola]